MFASQAQVVTTPQHTEIALMNYCFAACYLVSIREYRKDIRHAQAQEYAEWANIPVNIFRNAAAQKLNVWRHAKGL